MFALARVGPLDAPPTLARDRLGEKPLYYGTFGSGARATLLFGSELKALRAHPAFRGEIDRESLALYCALGYVPGARSIYRGVHKLLPGTWIEFTPGARCTPSRGRTGRPGTRRSTAARNPSRASEDELTERTRRAAAPRGQGRRCRPTCRSARSCPAASISSTVVALMQAQSSRPVHTFTIGFDEAGYNEAEHAKAIAAHLGTRSHRALRDARAGARRHPAAAARCTTSRSPIRRRSRRSWCRSWRAAT